ncbi:helix-turn-helix transcriptional regulator [Flavobacterium sp.]|jgi:transcriptional regulator with XRE-family HTH domain|uniref:helix-turn-helix transcriptional regulator n=1 Tax=Flavobacterium sp. TaxID=239 RepID=UPI004047E7EB
MKKFNHRKIKEFRVQKGLTQEEVADFLGVSQSTYYRLENGIGEMWGIYINGLCKIFQVKTSDFFTDDDN